MYLSTGMTVQLVLDVATLFYFHSAAYDILAARQAFFHNKPADFVYVTYSPDRGFSGMSLQNSA